MNTRTRLATALLALTILIGTAAPASAVTEAIGVSRHYGFWEGAYYYQYRSHTKYCDYSGQVAPACTYVEYHNQRLGGIGLAKVVRTGWHT